MEVDPKTMQRLDEYEDVTFPAPKQEQRPATPAQKRKSGFF